MLKIRKPLLPEWRYWPAVPFAALIAVALVGLNLTPPPPSPQTEQTTSYTPTKEVWPEIFSAIGCLTAEEATAIFTGLTAVIFFFQLLAMWRSNKHFRVTERAYVKLSHNPPGIEWDDMDDGRFWLTVRVKNHGRTPARIDGFSLNAKVFHPNGPVLRAPTYEHSTGRGAFLVADDSYGHTVFLRISPHEHEGVMAEIFKLAVFGYVDYSDQFGCRYRAGYGRWYSPIRDLRPPNISDSDFAQRNNLTYIEDAAYNYDRPRDPA